jgi:uncharacterized protein (TIGR02757 family)
VKPRFEVEHLRETLERLRAETDVADRVAHDPVEFPRRFDDPAEREVVALLAAALAYGNVRALRAAVADALARLPDSPRRFALAFRARGGAGPFRGWYYRLSRAEDLAGFFHAVGAVLRKRGSLARAFAAADAPAEGAPDYRPALVGLLRTLRAEIPARHRAPGLDHLLPRAAPDGALKRMNLYLRWVIRPDDGVDLGAWPGFSTARLTIPLDTHVARIGRYIGLTARSSPGWRTAREITESLGRLDPRDPVRYDFALSHLGISRECPARREPPKCARCGLRELCLLPPAPTVTRG